MTQLNLRHSQATRQSYEGLVPYIYQTPIVYSPEISKILGCHLYFKCEHLQNTGSFKVRGIVNYLLSQKNLADKNLITHSSGNHAIALSAIGAMMGFLSFAVIPYNTPDVKKKLLEKNKASILYTENSLKAREEKVAAFLEERPSTLYVPSSNNMDIIIGQSSVALEIIDELEDIENIVIPVGGGGLLAGSILLFKDLRPDIEITGVKPLENGLAADHSTIADGLKVKINNLPNDIINDSRTPILYVGDDSIVQALWLIKQFLGVLVEPSAAASLAAVIARPQHFANKKVAIILTGRNFDQMLLDDLLNKYQGSPYGPYLPISH
ncbi:MAG: serine dehydratase [Gammaproteobacteria bacterium]|jgi:threonine dehydratase|nr:serine dehydratase [Gammaproteobacteria bacterium]